MHEMSIAAEILDQVIEQAKVNNLVRVSEVTLEVGFLKQVVPELMIIAFESITTDTIVERARLKIVEVPSIAKCNECSYSFEPKINNFLCPKCERADVNVISGNDIILKAIFGEVKE
ncbi:MAG: hydrogenase maturation nickel metallochaperone HypA [Candidatus Zapsychrus exili]|nr:hydrogenase maturation nickel metallochaperone HypA [Candidatus Zapsychrus exili]